MHFCQTRAAEKRMFAYLLERFGELYLLKSTAVGESTRAYLNHIIFFTIYRHIFGDLHALHPEIFDADNACRLKHALVDKHFLGFDCVELLFFARGAVGEIDVGDVRVAYAGEQVFESLDAFAVFLGSLLCFLCCLVLARFLVQIFRRGCFEIFSVVDEDDVFAEFIGDEQFGLHRLARHGVHRAVNDDALALLPVHHSLCEFAPILGWFHGAVVPNVHADGLKPQDVRIHDLEVLPAVRDEIVAVAFYCLGHDPGREIFQRFIRPILDDGDPVVETYPARRRVPYRRELVPIVFCVVVISHWYPLPFRRRKAVRSWRKRRSRGRRRGSLCRSLRGGRRERRRARR